MQIWQSMLKILPNAIQFSCCEIDFETMEVVSNKLLPCKSCCRDRMLQEYCKDGTASFKNGIEKLSMPLCNVKPTTHAICLYENLQQESLKIDELRKTSLLMMLRRAF